MSIAFVALLDAIRDRLGRPMKIVSGYRTARHNQDVGGRVNSAHLRGFAADVFCREARFRYDLIECALQIGVKRFEIGPAWVHMDVDPSLPQDVIDLA
jgi:uncharacterized protein YcbK (DUF882 family)